MSYKQAPADVKYAVPQKELDALDQRYAVEREAVDFLRQREHHEGLAQKNTNKQAWSLVPTALAAVFLGVAGSEYKDSGFVLGVAANLIMAVSSMTMGFASAKKYKNRSDKAREFVDSKDQQLFIKNNGKPVVETVDEDGIREEFKANYSSKTLEWARQFEIKPAKI